MSLKIPKYIQLFPSLRCNKDCEFCFNRNIRPQGDMDVSKIPVFLRILSEENIREIDILGGEPTLYPYLFDIIDIAQRLKIKVFLSTNGTNIGTIQELLVRYPDKEQFSVGISINSEEISNELLDFIAKYKPIIKSVASKDKQIPKVIESILLIPDIKYYLLFMDTVTISDLSNSLSFTDYMNMLSNLKERFENTDGVYCSGFISRGNDDDTLEKIRCPAGSTKLSIMPDGSVYPCYLFGSLQEFRLGNIFDDDFKKILGSPILNFFRSFEGNKCPYVGCKIFHKCHGGCPAVSKLLLNNLQAADPRCK